MPERIPVSQTGYVHVFFEYMLLFCMGKKPAGQIFCMKKPTQIVYDSDHCSFRDWEQQPIMS